jgi:hypothetical protein
MKPRTTDIIVVRQWGAEHQSRGGYWLNWYLANVITGDTPEAIRANVRRYWRGDCLDAYLVPDTATAIDIAETYAGAWADDVRGIAACLALGENPRGEGGSRVVADIPPEPVAPSGGAVTLDALVMP